MSNEGVMHKSIRGGAWLALGYFLQKCIGLASFLVLARLLLPSEFGVMAIVLLTPKFLESVTDTGFATALIQKSEDIRQYLDPTWTIRIIKTVVLALLIALLSPFIASFFHVEAALPAIMWSGAFIVIQSLSNIGETFFLKELDFKKIVFRNIAREIAFVVVALIAVFITRSYWALFFAHLAAYAVQMIATYVLSPYRPKLSFRFRPLWELLPYSKWIIGQRWLAQVYMLLENATVARLAPVHDVGLYSKAKSLSAVIPVFLSSTLGMVSFPAYAKLQDATSAIQEGFRKSMEVLFFFTIPAAVLVWSGGGRLISLFIGETWLPMLPVLQVLTLYFVLNGINDMAVSVFNATGIPKKQAIHSGVRFFVTAITIIPLTSMFGVVGAAVSLTIAAMLVLILNLESLHSKGLASYLALLHALALPLGISLVLFAVVTVFRESIVGLSAASFAAFAAASGLSYLLITYLAGRLFAYGPYKTIRLILEGTFKNK